MKKMAFLALVLTVGMLISVEAGAASVGIPWFVDTAGNAQGIPPADGKVVTLIYLNNGSATETLCSITYFTQTGQNIGAAHINGTGQNTFLIPASSTVAFRPVANDPDSVAGGQESSTAQMVPNRPLGTAGGNDDKKNGSARVDYDNTGGDITGKAESYQLKDMTSSGKGYYSSSHAYLLPGG